MRVSKAYACARYLWPVGAVGSNPGSPPFIGAFVVIRHNALSESLTKRGAVLNPLCAMGIDGLDVTPDRSHLALYVKWFRVFSFFLEITSET